MVLCQHLRMVREQNSRRGTAIEGRFHELRPRAWGKAPRIGGAASGCPYFHRQQRWFSAQVSQPLRIRQSDQGAGDRPSQRRQRRGQASRANDSAGGVACRAIGRRDAERPSVRISPLTCISAHPLLSGDIREVPTVDNSASTGCAAEAGEPGQRASSAHEAA
jgi:hypothetical protein